MILQLVAEPASQSGVVRALIENAVDMLREWDMRQQGSVRPIIGNISMLLTRETGRQPAAVINMLYNRNKLRRTVWSEEMTG